MEKRAPSHTEEEEMNQRRRLLHLARKGDQKAIGKLFELYQVRVFSGDNLRKAGKLPVWPGVAAANAKEAKRREAAQAAARNKAAKSAKKGAAPVKAAPRHKVPAKKK
ncbi:hypothetical protein YTPLAS18_17650 [Nitrospira sp.]|nr:hypothetical protein YTPLAS18_17650 [Nitrospira sp.]